ncbi:MAG: hypothetical protein ACP5RS_03300 [Thermoplasmata archaeon]
MPNGLKPEQLGFVSYGEIPVSIPESSSRKLHESITFKKLTLYGVTVHEPEFIILDNIDFPVIIGVEVLQTMKIMLDFKPDTLRF